MRARYAVALSLLGSLSACGSCRGTKETAPADAPSAVAASSLGLTPEQARKPLARFGDRSITLGEFAQVLADLPEFERLRYQSIERRKELLRAMIDVQLLAEEARRAGLDQDPQVAEETRQLYVAWLRGRLLAELPQPQDLPEAEVRAYYDRNLDQFREPERRRVAHIVTRDEATARRAYEEAKSASATQWGAIVRKYSEEKPDASEAAEMAGDLGFVTGPKDSGSTVSVELRTAAFALTTVGSVTAPVKDAHGWHVLRLLARNEARDQSFADVERSIRLRLLQQRREAKERTLIDETRKRVPVEIDETAVASVAAELLAESPASSSASASTAAPR